MKEVWKKIEKNPVYEVSNLGSIRRFIANRYKDIKLQEHKKGYMKVGLGKSGKEYVHRLVALSFVENPDNKPHVNHKDGIKKNNISDNLEWCTPVENNIHSIEVLGSTIRIPVIAVDRKDGEVMGEFVSKLSAEKSLKSLRGIILIPKNEYSVEYVMSIINKPRKKAAKRTVYIPSPSRRLNSEQVIDIIRMGMTTDIKLYHIAVDIGCDFMTVKNILSGKNYREISVPELEKYGVKF